MNLYEQLRALIESSRAQVMRAVNTATVELYWLIGQHLVHDEQGGQARAEYGKGLLADVATRLTADYGSGFDETNLRKMRQFYLAYPNRDTLRLDLTWSHYRLLMRVENPNAREFYGQEAAEQHWTVRNLERQIHSFFYERLLTSRDRAAMLAGPPAGQAPTYRDFIKNPFVLEFLGLPAEAKTTESELEQALIDNLHDFLLELGKGFAFVARQKFIRTETSEFFIDLVFYNYVLKCFVLIDLKVGKLTHQDVGQMDMYVRMYEDLYKAPDDNPTIGLILCSEPDATIARYSVLHESEHLFASRYVPVLPTEEELRQELERELRLLRPRNP